MTVGQARLRWLGRHSNAWSKGGKGITNRALAANRMRRVAM
jgi:hypothetical protein